MENSKNVVLHDCLVSRRGKGAKGTVAIKTFGIPVKVKDEEITKDFDYSFADALTITEVIDSVEKLSGLNLKLIKEAIYRGVDLVKRSSAIQVNAVLDSVIAYVKEHKLARDNDDAIVTAKGWLQTQELMKKNMMGVPTIEDLADGKRKFIAEQITKGLWATKLVDVPKEEDKTEDNSDEDSQEEAAS